MYRLIFLHSGAQGEYAGLRVIRAYHEHQGAPQRRVTRGRGNILLISSKIDFFQVCLIPISAHGTNFASASKGINDDLLGEICCVYLSHVWNED